MNLNKTLGLKRYENQNVCNEPNTHDVTKTTASFE